MPPKRKQTAVYKNDIVPIRFVICNQNLKVSKETSITQADNIDAVASTCSIFSDLTSEVMIPLVNFKTAVPQDFNKDDSTLNSIISTDIFAQIDN
jgi:hypothetical protein